MTIQTLQVGPIGTNCYLLCDETARVCAVVDPGDEPERILSAVRQSGCTVEKILLTHGHYDHTGGVAGLLRALPLTEVYIHRADFEFPLPQLFPLKAELAALPDVEMHFYGDGDALSVGDLRVQVLHTPGHSEGSVTLQCGNALFCGDTLFAGSCGRTDFPGGSMKTIMTSLARLAALKGDCQVLPGHMEPSTLDRERAGNPYMQMAARGQV